MAAPATADLKPRGTYALLTPLITAALVVVAIVFLWQAPSSYEIYKGLHVVAAVLWVGGGLSLIILAISAELRNDAERLTFLGHSAEWIGNRVFTPASLAVLGFGIAMTAKGDIGYDEFWILFALVVWAVSALTGALFLGPTAKKLAKLTEQHGPGHPEVQRTLRTLLTVARVDGALLLLVVIDMTVKPFLG